MFFTLMMVYHFSIFTSKQCRLEKILTRCVWWFETRKSEHSWMAWGRVVSLFSGRANDSLSSNEKERTPKKKNMLLIFWEYMSIKLTNPLVSLYSPDSLKWWKRRAQLQCRFHYLFALLRVACHGQPMLTWNQIFIWVFQMQ